MAVWKFYLELCIRQRINHGAFNFDDILFRQAGYLPACSFLFANFINYCSSFAVFSPSGNSRWIFPVFYVFYTKMLDIDAIFRNLQIYFSSKYPFFCFLSSFCTKCTTFSFSITFLAPFRIVCSRPAFELHLPGICPVFSPFTPLKAVF